MRIEQWLGQENQLGIDIWHKKYQQNNETFEEWLDRVSAGNKEIRQLIVDKKFLFGGRILSNRGMSKYGKKVTYSNCYVIAPPEDNIESIFEAASKLARTFSYGGGCGLDISKLAPRGATINNTAKATTGSVSFMDLYNLITELIGQNGRRAALMLSLSCDHPDLEEFISVKNDLNKITKANISIRITDEFMKAVVQKQHYNLTFVREETGEEIVKNVYAPDIFRQLCENNWNFGEPGMLYWDTIKNYNMLSQHDDFKFAGVNPCVTGDTLIQTIEGQIPIKELVGTRPYVYCMDDYGKLTIRQASKVWKTRRNAELVEVDFNRDKLLCTPDHLIFTRNRGWVKAIDLLPKDKLNGLGFHKGNEIDEIIKLTSDNRQYRHHRFIMQEMGHDIHAMDIHHIDGDHLNNVYSNLEILTHNEHSKITNIGHENYADRDLKTGRFISKSYKDKRKTNGNVNYDNKGKNFIVKNVRLVEFREDVYDMTVPGVHNFIANDIVIHNCAEQPLPAGGSCLLGSLNLAAFVNNGIFDMLGFCDAVGAAVRALNEVLDEGLALHPLKEQQESVADWRQIGLGIFGLADMLIKMGIEYGSEEAVIVCDDIGDMMAYEAMTTSAMIAKEKGSFPKFNKEALFNSPFYMEHRDNALDTLIDNFGIRNSQILTVAPTGSLSTMLGVSGGIEPIFDTHYTRKTESLHGHEEYYIVYTPIVKEYMDANGVTDIDQLPGYFTTAKKIKGNDRIAMQAVWQKHIDASISSTVNIPESATVEDVEDLYISAWKAGLKGLTIFRENCARLSILTSGDKPKEEESEEEMILDANKETVIKLDTITPKSRDELGTRLNGSTYIKEIACGKLYITINRDENNNLVEVFIDPGKSGGCSANAECIGRYASACMRCGMSIEAIVDVTKGVKCSACTQAKGAKKKKIDGLSCGDVIARTIQEEYNLYHKDEEVKGIEVEPVIEETEEEKFDSAQEKMINILGKTHCPECGNEIANSGGCTICLNCGYSKCD